MFIAFNFNPLIKFKFRFITSNKNNNCNECDDNSC